MSPVVPDRRAVCHAVRGGDEPVIPSQGGLKSQQAWRGTTDLLSHTDPALALDLRGLDDSVKHAVGCSIYDDVDLVGQLMESLGTWRAAALGNSMGGIVSLGPASRRPDRVQHAAVVSTSIQGKGLALSLRPASRLRLVSPACRLAGALALSVRLFSPLLARDWKTWYRISERDLSRTTLECLRPGIGYPYEDISSPRPEGIRRSTPGIYSRGDNFVDPEQGAVLASGTPSTQLDRFERHGCFSTCDRPERSLRVLRRFFSHQPVSDVN